MFHAFIIMFFFLYEKWREPEGGAWGATPGERGVGATKCGAGERLFPSPFFSRKKIQIFLFFA